MSRWLRFLIVIILGLVLGLLYGWVLAPVEYVDTTPDTLRVDYKADYILMVAEIYHQERDLGLVRQRLSLLGPAPALEMAQQALVFAVDNDYSADDLRLLRDLAEALGGFSLEQEQP